jgi:hypothetical protein
MEGWACLFLEAFVDGVSESPGGRPLAPCREDDQFGGKYAVHDPFEFLSAEVELSVALFGDVQVNGRVDA